MGKIVEEALVYRAGLQKLDIRRRPAKFILQPQFHVLAMAAPVSIDDKNKEFIFLSLCEEVS
jgi:hypothetical protein